MIHHSSSIHYLNGKHRRVLIIHHRFQSVCHSKKAWPRIFCSYYFLQLLWYYEPKSRLKFFQTLPFYHFRTIQTISRKELSDAGKRGVMFPNKGIIEYPCSSWLNAWEVSMYSSIRKIPDKFLEEKRISTLLTFTRFFQLQSNKVLMMCSDDGKFYTYSF